MRFMMMHKNDANTEAGKPPPMELVHKMGAFVSEHAQAGRFIDGAGLGEQDAHALGLPQRTMHGKARSLSWRT